MQWTARWALVWVLVTVTPFAPAKGDDDRRNHERARRALEAGEIRPLREMLTDVEERYAGRVIEVELDRERDNWIYEFKLLPPNGSVFILEIDASSGVLISSRGRIQERPRRD